MDDKRFLVRAYSSKGLLLLGRCGAQSGFFTAEEIEQIGFYTRRAAESLCEECYSLSMTGKKFAGYTRFAVGEYERGKDGYFRLVHENCDLDPPQLEQFDFFLAQSNVVFVFYQAALNGEITKDDFFRAKEIIRRATPYTTAEIAKLDK